MCSHSFSSYRAIFFNYTALFCAGRLGRGVQKVQFGKNEPSIHCTAVIESYLPRPNLHKLPVDTRSFFTPAPGNSKVASNSCIALTSLLKTPKPKRVQKVGKKGAGARRRTLGIPNESLGQIHFKNAGGKGRRPPGRPPEAGEGRRRTKFFFGSNGSF